MTSFIDSVKSLVSTRFEQFPHYSFGDGTIMTNHTFLVHKIALELSAEMECNRLVVELCALLHDIGKTAELDPEILESDHEILGWAVSKEFLSSGELPQGVLISINDFFEGKPSVERDIVKDADILAFYLDQVLQSAYTKWAVANNKSALIQKKWEKFNRLKFEKSKELGAEAWSSSLKKNNIKL